MRERALPFLSCPACGGELSIAAGRRPDGSVEEGSLSCSGCGVLYPVRRSIPRFVTSEAYASTFGMQWKRFRLEQLDPFSGTSLSERRFRAETGWNTSWLAGKVVLDAGCGAGRFLEVASRDAGLVFGLDYSEAVDAARESLAGRENVELVQADIYALPFRTGALDGCYCIGVIQHTPDPARALAGLPRLLRPGGRLAVTAYERRRFTLLSGKYLARRVFRRVSPAAKLRLIQAVMPVLFPLTEVLFRLPLLGRVFRFVLPIANYVDEPQLSVWQRYRWAVLDTFDMLAPVYDTPQREHDLRRALGDAGLEKVARLPNPGVNLVGARASHSPGEEAHEVSQSAALGERQ